MEKTSNSVAYINKCIDRKKYKDNLILIWLEMYFFQIKHQKHRLKSFEIYDSGNYSAHHAFRLLCKTENGETVNCSLYRFKKFCRTRELAFYYGQYVSFQTQSVKINPSKCKLIYKKYYEEKIFFN